MKIKQIYYILPKIPYYGISVCKMFVIYYDYNKRCILKKIESKEYNFDSYEKLLKKALSFYDTKKDNEFLVILDQSLNTYNFIEEEKYYYTILKYDYGGFYESKLYFDKNFNQLKDEAIAIRYSKLKKLEKYGT